MKKIYGIRDTVAKDWAGIGMYILFVMLTDQQAVRYFADAIFDKSTALAKHPEDYELVKLGYIEEDNLSEPLLISENQYTVVITGAALVAAQQEPK